jgi:hypothetical protein
MHRSLATHLAVLVSGLALGIGAVAVAQDNPPPRASAAAADSRIVRELQTANRRLGAQLLLMNFANRKLDVVNENLSGFTATGPVGGSIRDVLRQVCVNTANSAAQAAVC